MRPWTFPGIFLGPTGNQQGTHRVFDNNTGIVKKPRTITPLPMPDRVITVVEDWGRRHIKENNSTKLKFLNQIRQQYDWDNEDLEYNKGLIKPDNAHPNIPAEFPGIHLDSEQPIHHHAVKIIEQSDKERIHAVQQNTSLDNPPTKTTGVSTAVDQLNVDTWDKTQDDDDFLPTNNTALHDLTQQQDDNEDDSTQATETNDATIEEADAAKEEEETFGSTYFNGQHRSTRNQIPTRLTKVNFDNKSYTDGHYKDGTIHITIPSHHDADHPFPINPDPLMHVLGVALLHYYTPEI